MLQLCTQLLTRSGFRKCGGPGARHATFAHHRPHSSGSAQFCGILSERLLAPVSDEKKSMKQQQKPEQKRNGWPDAKIERTGARRDLSSRFVDNDLIPEKRYDGEKA